MLKEHTVITGNDQKKLHIKEWVPESFGSPQKTKNFQKKELSAQEKQEEEILKIKKLAQEQGLKNGKEQGYQIGLKEGLEAAEKETSPLKQQLLNIVEKLSPLAVELEESCTKSIIQLAYQIAAMVIRVEGKINPEILQATLKEVFAQLPSMLGSYTLWANSQDILAIEGYLSQHYPEAQIHLQTDDTLIPGGIRLQGPIVFVEGSLEQRLLNLIRQKSSL